MFNLDRFAEDCLDAQRGSDSQQAIRALLTEAVATPNDIITALGEPSQAGVHKLYHTEELTILNVVWAPLMTIRPHEHNMVATIGIYSGREDNIFWRRNGNRIEAAGAKALCLGDVETLGKDIVHSVTNPIEKFTGALHIYGGDFFEVERHEWEPETLTECAYDMENTHRTFREANERYPASAVKP